MFLPSLPSPFVTLVSFSAYCFYLFMPLWSYCCSSSVLNLPVLPRPTCALLILSFCGLVCTQVTLYTAADRTPPSKGAYIMQLLCSNDAVLSRVVVMPKVSQPWLKPWLCSHTQVCMSLCTPVCLCAVAEWQTPLTGPNEHVEWLFLLLLIWH